MLPTWIRHRFEDWARHAGVPVQLRLPDGQTLQAGDGQAGFTLAFRSDLALQMAAARGQMGLLQAYFDQALDVEGPLKTALAAGLAAESSLGSDLVARLENRWHEWRRTNRDRAQAKANAELHYGLPEAFYRLWLDEPLKMYTCAYWAEGVSTLEEAQRRKIDHVARKLRLQPDDRVLEIGCGFGGFMLRTAEVFGVEAVGVNTAAEQVRWLQGAIRARGLERRVRVVEADFRQRQGVFDKVVSIGVLEHAGRDQLADMVRAHADQLAPGGLGLMHLIGHMGRHETDPFIRKFVFPGGWIPALSDVLVEMERCGLELLDVENLRRHYALTLDEWSRRFDMAWPQIQSLDPMRFDERFRRVWSVYLTGCAEMFRNPRGHTHLFQVVFSKGNVTEGGYPMTRAFLHG